MTLRLSEALASLEGVVVRERVVVTDDDTETLAESETDGVDVGKLDFDSD